MFWFEYLLLAIRRQLIGYTQQRLVIGILFPIVIDVVFLQQTLILYNMNITPF